MHVSDYTIRNFVTSLSRGTVYDASLLFDPVWQVLEPMKCGALEFSEQGHKRSCNLHLPELDTCSRRFIPACESEEPETAM